MFQQDSNALDCKYVRDSAEALNDEKLTIVAGGTSRVEKSVREGAVGGAVVSAAIGLPYGAIQGAAKLGGPGIVAGAIGGSIGSGAIGATAGAVYGAVGATILKRQ